MEQTVTACQEEQRCGSKWLKWLLIVNIISLTYATLKNVIFTNDLNLLMLGIGAGVVFCLFKLHRAHKLYAVAAVLLSVELLCLAIRMVFGSMPVIQYILELLRTDDPAILLKPLSVVLQIGQLCGALGFFLELLAHFVCTRNVKAPLSKCWLVLSIVVFILYILMQVLQQVVTELHSKGILNITLYQEFYPVLNLPGKLAEISHVVLLFLTWRALPNAGDQGDFLAKKKYIILSLIIGGVTLLTLSALLTLHDMSNLSIIGGLSWPTFRYIFAERNGGFYSDLACFGVMALVSALIMSIVHRKRTE